MADDRLSKKKNTIYRKFTKVNNGKATEIYNFFV